VSVWAVVGNLSELVRLPTEFSVPGSAVFHADHAGAYKVFLMTDTVSGGEYRSPGEKIEPPKGLIVDVVRKDDGRKPKLSQDTGESFSSGSKSGKSLFGFEAEAPGDYVVSGRFEDGDVHAKAMLGIGKGFSFGAFAKIFGVGAIGGLIVFAGIMIAAVTFIRWIAARSSKSSQPAPRT
jgi:hypothetical protein